MNSAVADLLKQLEDLIGVVPNPSVDHDALVALRDADPAARRLAEQLDAKSVWRGTALRNLLPGLTIIDSSSFRHRLGARIANQLIRAGIDSWFALSSLTPAELSLMSGIGAEAKGEILLAASGEWATAYLHAAGRGQDAAQVERPGLSVGGTRQKQMLELIGRAPDPEGDRELLAVLCDPDGADSRWLAEMFYTDSEFRYLSLRQLLPGLGLVESLTFSVRLSVRAANSLGRVNAETLSALAGLTPADILARPDVGPKTGEEILAAAISEWATSYLDQGQQEQAERHAGGEDALSGENVRRSWRDLASAFARIEQAVGFEAFRHRQLDPGSHPTQAAVAAELGISPERVAHYEKAIRVVLAKQVRDRQSPFSIAVDYLKSRLGPLAQPQDLNEALATIDPAEKVMPESMPQRRALLLRLAGLRLSSEWVVDVEMESIIEALLRGLTENGPVELEVLGGHLTRLGFRETLRLPWIAGQPGFQMLDNKLTRIAEE